MTQADPLDSTQIPAGLGVADGIATITLARPRRGNALSAELVDAIHTAMDSALADASVHTLVFRAEGAHFCTGFDLGDLDTSSDGDLLLRFVRIEQLLARVWAAPVRTVALAQGRCWGAGADLFAACEERIASTDASFRFPGAGFGIVLGTRRLIARVGEHLGRRLVTNALTIDADMAKTCGLATTLAAPDETDALLAQCSAAPRVTATTAGALRAASRSGDASALEADLAALVRSAAAPGLRERIATYRDAVRASARKHD
ncbi:MAG: enoyl-CoA hydratase/isomerase family protein [Burkholderiaceae bacterium]